MKDGELGMEVGSFFFFRQQTAYDIRLSLVGSEMCISDSLHAGPANHLRTSHAQPLADVGAQCMGCL